MSAQRLIHYHLVFTVLYALLVILIVVLIWNKFKNNDETKVEVKVEGEEIKVYLAGAALSGKRVELHIQEDN